MSSQEVNGTPTRASRRKSLSQQSEDVIATPEKGLGQVMRHMELKMENSPSTPGRRGSRAVNSPLAAKKAMIAAAPVVSSPARRTTRSMSQEKELQPPPAAFTRITRRRSSLMESDEELDQSITRPTTSLRATASRKSIVNQTISEEAGEEDEKELNNSTDNELELRTRSISKSPNVSAHSPLSMSIVDKSQEEKPAEIVDMSICTSPKTPKNQLKTATPKSAVKSAEKRKSIVPAVSEEDINELMQTQLAMDQSMEITGLHMSKIQDKKRFTLPAPASPQQAAKSPSSKKKSLPASFDNGNVDEDISSPVKVTPTKSSWDVPFKSNAGSRIDRIVSQISTPVLDGLQRLFSPKRRTPIVAKPVIDLDSDESDREAKTHPFIEGECEVNSSADDGDDTMSEGEKEYLEQNEIEERGEVLGSDDTEEDEGDEEEENDSFIDDDEDVKDQYSMSSDEEGEEEVREPTKIVKMKRVIKNSSDSEDEEEKENAEKPSTPLKVKSPSAGKVATPKIPTPARADKSLSDTQTPVKSAEKAASAKKSKTPKDTPESTSSKKSAQSKHSSDDEEEEEGREPTKIVRMTKTIENSSDSEDEEEKENAEKPSTPSKVKSPSGQLNQSAAKLNSSSAGKVTSPKITSLDKADKSLSETKTPAKSAEKATSAKKSKTPKDTTEPTSSKKSAKRKHDSDDEEEQEAQVAEDKRSKKRKLDESLNITVDGEKVLSKKRLKMSNSESEKSSSEDSDAADQEDEPMDASSEDSESEAAGKKNIHEAVVATCSDYMEKFNEEKRKREALKRIRKAEKLAKKKEEAAAKDQSDSSKENSTIKKKKKNKRKIKKTKSVEEVHQEKKNDVGVVAAEIASKLELKKQAKIQKNKLKKQMKIANAAAAAAVSTTSGKTQPAVAVASASTVKTKPIIQVPQNNDLANAKKKLKKQNGFDDSAGNKRKFADVLPADHNGAEKPKKKLKIISTVDDSAPILKKKQTTNDKNHVEEIKLNSTSSKIRKIVQNPVQVEKKKSQKSQSKKIPENRSSLPRPVWSSSGVWIEEPRTPFKFSSKQKYTPAVVPTPEELSVAKLKTKSKSAGVLPRVDIRTASVLQNRPERDGSMKNLKGLMSSKSARN